MIIGIYVYINVYINIFFLKQCIIFVIRLQYLTPTLEKNLNLQK